MSIRSTAPAAFSFWCGLSSLGLEILWVRLFGYAHQGNPKAFGFVLCAFLVGVAFGAAAGRRRCVSHAAEPARLWLAMGWCLLWSGLAAVALPVLFAEANRTPFALLTAFIGIALTAFLLAFCFPIAHHLGAQTSSRQGRSFARVYASNVAGSALGPLLTGYLLLEYLSLQQAFQLVALLQLAVGAVTCWLAARPAARSAGRFYLPVFALVVALAVWSLPPDPHWLIQQVQVDRAKTIHENRQGVIALVEGGAEGDMVLGGNAYDGRTNTDLVVNSNGLHRLTLMSVVKPRPRRVLMVGMSIGSWLAVVRRFPGVEHIDVIEINPGYVVTAQAYEAQRAAMADPRVAIHIDDARRWLRLNPAEKYDAIIMNTTFHWRSNATLLLSSEFLSIMRQHLEPGGVLCFNATGSLDALFTASSVFAHAWRYSNFVYAADHDFRPLKDAPEALQTYRNLFFGGAVSPAGDQQLLGYLARPFVDYASDRLAAGREGELITDENMVTEFRRGTPF
jgi:spermidine synthase